jgi:membrane associated rhomboid family serine protease
MESQAAMSTFLVILLTAVVSLLGFQNRMVVEKYIFEPERILAWKEYYRLITSGFLHADFIHLALNMVSLYLFGRSVERMLGPGQFLLVYFGAVIGGGLLSLYVHRHHEYRAYGASGGVCGIIFSYMLLFPGARISALPLPIFIPAWLYAIGFMVGSFYAMKAGRDNVGHDAHLGGAIVGLLLTAALQPWSVRSNLKIFLLVLGLSLLLLGYLWLNPLFLPLISFKGRGALFKRKPGQQPAAAPESRRVDALLEKIAREGMASLSAEERALLDRVSDKYRRREQSEKPKSGLSI